MVTAGVMAPEAGSTRTTRRAVRSDTQSLPSGPQTISQGEARPLATTRAANGAWADPATITRASRAANPDRRRMGPSFFVRRSTARLRDIVLFHFLDVELLRARNDLVQGLVEVERRRL